MDNNDFTNYMNRRRGLRKALTEDFKINTEKCKAVMPGSTYTQRYVLVGLENGEYEIKHPTFDEKSAPPPCLPPYHGQVTERVWLTIALESVNAWLASTLVSDFDAHDMSEDERKDLLRRVNSLSNLQEDVLSFYDGRLADEVKDVAVSLAASNILGHCEKKSCMFIGESDWVECLVCKTWYHGLCVGISSSDDHRRYRFICGSC